MLPTTVAGNEFTTAPSSRVATLKTGRDRSGKPLESDSRENHPHAGRGGRGNRRVGRPGLRGGLGSRSRHGHGMAGGTARRRRRRPRTAWLSQWVVIVGPGAVGRAV